MSVEEVIEHSGEKRSLLNVLAVTNPLDVAGDGGAEPRRYLSSGGRGGASEVDEVLHIATPLDLGVGPCGTETV